MLLNKSKSSLKSQFDSNHTTFHQCHRQAHGYNIILRWNDDDVSKWINHYW